MTVKCIAIGNPIMCDDSIGIRVAEEISPRLRSENIEVIFGETDIDYALSKIDDGDLLFIIDSAYFGVKPGTVTFTPIVEAALQHQHIYSQHQPSLINLLETYGKPVEGFIIGIELERVDFGLELSDTLKARLPYICEEVYRFIYHTKRRIYHA